jgi:hypothetical protein
MDTMALLNNGLKFSPTLPRLTQQQLLSAVQRYQRSVRLRCMFQHSGPLPKYRVSNPAFVPLPAPPAVEAYLSRVESVCLAQFNRVEQQQQQQPNLSVAQRQALRALRSNRALIIKAADKNLGPTVMDTADCQAAVRSVVDDSHVYEDVTCILPRVISATRRKLLNLVASFHVCLGDKLSEYLLQGLDCTTVPSLYILPKLHKMRSLDSPIIGRPIAACHSWITTHASIWLADLLNKCLTIQLCSQIGLSLLGS